MRRAQELTPTNRDHLLLFVTGIPSKTSPPAVLQHFLQFGNVRIARLDGTNRGSRVFSQNPTANTRRGFCVLQPQDFDSRERIMNSQHVQFQGRTLGISLFRQGLDLFAHNDFLSSKRVVLKKVPAGTCLEFLRGLLESQFGPIERIYCYEAKSSEKASKKELKRRTHTYSVEFMNSNSADLATINSYMFLPLGDSESPIVVERFQKKKNPFKQPPKSSNLNVFYTCPAGGTILQKHEYPRILFTGNSNKVTPTSDDTEAQRFSESRRILKLGISDHCMKPTSRMYHCTRATKSVNDHEILELSLHAIRFNVDRSRKTKKSQNQLGFLLKRNEKNRLLRGKMANDKEVPKMESSLFRIDEEK